MLDPLTQEPLLDRGPNLAIVELLLRISRRRAQLRGIDAPRRREALVVTTDMVEAEISRMSEEAERLEALAREQEETP